MPTRKQKHVAHNCLILIIKSDNNKQLSHLTLILFFKFITQTGFCNTFMNKRETVLFSHFQCNIYYNVIVCFFYVSALLFHKHFINWTVFICLNLLPFLSARVHNIVLQQ